MTGVFRIHIIDLWHSCREFYSKSGKQIWKPYINFTDIVMILVIHVLINSSNSVIIIFIHPLRKASLKDLSNTLRTEQNILMNIIFADAYVLQDLNII
jgi:hypothetical protein